MWFRQCGSGGGIDAKVDAVFVQRRDRVGVNEPADAFDPNHDPVKDVLGGSGDDVVDSPDLNTIGRVHGDPLIQHLVGNRITLVHARTLPRSNRRGELAW